MPETAAGRALVLRFGPGLSQRQLVEADVANVEAEARAIGRAEALPTVDRLAAILDHHWLSQGINTGTAYCSCGGWSFDAKSGQHPLPTMGERFAPFSRHVAQAAIDNLETP